MNRCLKKQKSKVQIIRVWYWNTVVGSFFRESGLVFPWKTPIFVWLKKGCRHHTQHHHNHHHQPHHQDYCACLDMSGTFHNRYKHETEHWSLVSSTEYTLICYENTTQDKINQNPATSPPPPPPTHKKLPPQQQQKTNNQNKKKGTKQQQQQNHRHKIKSFTQSANFQSNPLCQVTKWHLIPFVKLQKDT